MNPVARARNKFLRHYRPLVEVCYRRETLLVAPADGDWEGMFTPDEFNLVPAHVLESYRGVFEDVREALDAMEEELDQACRVREAAEKRA